MKPESRAIFEQRKIRGTPKGERPRCGARTRAGGRCQAQALLNSRGDPGRCRMHGGLSRGPTTPEGKERLRESARQRMIEQWAKLKAEGRKFELSPEGLEKRRQSARKHMRMRHRRRHAVEWADWMMEQNRDHEIRLWNDRRQAVILRPYLAQLTDGDVEALQEMAVIAGFDPFPDNTEITQIILARYAPKFSIIVAADDLRRGAEGRSLPKTPMEKNGLKQGFSMNASP